MFTKLIFDETIPLEQVIVHAINWRWLMFVITRNNDGETEFLKDSSTQSDKTFANFYTADLLMQQLNQNVIPSKHWTVSEMLR